MKDKKKIANVIEGAVIVLFGVLVAIFGGVAVVDTYLGILALVAGAIFTALVIAKLIKEKTLPMFETLYACACFGIGIGLLTHYISLGILVNVIVLLVISLGAGIVLIGVYSIIKKAMSLGIMQIILGAICITLGLLYLLVDGFAQAFWIIVGIVIAALGIFFIVSQFVDLKKKSSK